MGGHKEAGGGVGRWWWWCVCVSLCERLLQRAGKLDPDWTVCLMCLQCFWLTGTHSYPALEIRCQTEMTTSRAEMSKGRCWLEPGSAWLNAAVADRGCDAAIWLCCCSRHNKSPVPNEATENDGRHDAADAMMNPDIRATSYTARCDYGPRFIRFILKHDGHMMTSTSLCLVPTKTCGE